MTELWYSGKAGNRRKAGLAIAAAVAALLCPLNAGASIRSATGNPCDAAGVSAAVADRIFGTGSSLGVVSGYTFCALTPATNRGSGYIEVIKQPKSTFASLVAHYSYQGPKSSLPGLGAGAVWYHQGATAESVIFTAGANAFAIAVNISAKPFPTRAKLTALAAAIRSHFA